ncbi:homeobox-leucine zipper protein HOX11 [Nymphaea colorata]|nr:homeobox-leucine zipper protein HOX11 [Nymphaea colorata]
MDLALSLGDSAKPFRFMAKTSHNSVGFKMGLSLDTKEGHGEAEEGRIHVEDDEEERSSTDPPVQLDLLPLLPISHQHQAHQSGFPWPSENGNSEAEVASTRGFDVNRAPFGGDLEEEAAVSSPNSTVSSFHMDFGVLPQSRRDPDGVHNVGEGERASSRASDEEENGLTRKKLRLTKEQSAFLEESFREHNTLNPKQKLALAKQLNLRPRQVEVWFQNRRARTKLKQTEVDCEYLKRCCETLTEENRRLQRELQELRALKTAQPFYMQLPATTLTMCPSCERVASAAAADNSSTNKATTPAAPGSGFPLSTSKARFYQQSSRQQPTDAS